MAFEVHSLPTSRAPQRDHLGNLRIFKNCGKSSDLSIGSLNWVASVGSADAHPDAGVKPPCVAGTDEAQFTPRGSKDLCKANWMQNPVTSHTGEDLRPATQKNSCHCSHWRVQNSLEKKHNSTQQNLQHLSEIPKPNCNIVHC